MATRSPARPTPPPAPVGAGPSLPAPVGAGPSVPDLPPPVTVDPQAAATPAGPAACSCSLLPWIIAAGAVAWALTSTKEK